MLHRCFKFIWMPFVSSLGYLLITMAVMCGTYVTSGLRFHVGGTTSGTLTTLRKLGYPLESESEVGPLIDQAGKCISFAPLLRTREVLQYGIIRASWTLYQPHALVWNYAFWNGRINFGKACRLGANKIPHLKWEQIVPPPFLKAWFRFLGLCENRNMQGQEIDEALAPLLPLFHCDNFCLPFRILKETEVAALSGLHFFLFFLLHSRASDQALSVIEV